MGGEGVGDPQCECESVCVWVSVSLQMQCLSWRERERERNVLGSENGHGGKNGKCEIKGCTLIGQQITVLATTNVTTSEC